MKINDSELNNLIKSGHSNAYIEALTLFQAIENLLVLCIKASDFIIDVSSDKLVTFNPNRKNLSKLGLGSLAEVFKGLTKNKDLCNNIKELNKERNMLAHSKLIPFLRISLSEKNISDLNEQTFEINQIASSARALFLELMNEYQQLLEIKNELTTNA